MGSALDSASLIMYPSGYSDGVLGSAKPTDGSGDFTFTRGSNLSATRIGPNGYIEKGYENLLLQSNSFDTTWTTTNASVTGGQAGYDGSSDAWLLTGLVGSHALTQNISNSGVATYSLYAKAGTGSGIRIRAIGSTTYTMFVALTDGTIFSNNGIDGKVIDAGNGWYKYEFTFNTSLTSIQMRITNGATGDFAGTIYIQDAMLNQGLVAYPYIETTTAPVAGGILEDEPRIDFSDGCGHLLLEPSRTNALSHSEYLNAISSKSNSLEMNTSDTKSPEGVYNASKFDFTSGTRYIGPSIGTINDVVVSVFAKAGTHNFVQFVSSGNDLFTINFDLSNGSSNVVGTAPSELQYDAEDYGNGWYRIWFYYDNAGVNSTIYCWIVNSLTSSRASSVSTSGDVYLYGYQVEQDATYPTSYIPTYGVSQTRLGDVCDGNVNASNFNDAAGTLYAEIKINDINGVISIKSSTGNNYGYISPTSNNRMRFAIRDTQGLRYNDANAYIPDAFNKVILKYDSNGFYGFVNGVKILNNTSVGTLFSGIDKMSFEFGNNDYYGLVKQTLLFPTALSDDECIALTTI